MAKEEPLELEGVIDEILSGLSRAVAARAVAGVADLVGRTAREWALSG